MLRRGPILPRQRRREQHAQSIYKQVVVTKIMPMNNSTGITDDERARIKQWFEAGAKTQ